MIKTSRIAAVALAAALSCGSVAWASQSATDAKPAMQDGATETVAASLETATWAEGLDCAECHKKQAEAPEPTEAAVDKQEDGDGVQGLLEYHVGALGFTCTTCHYDEEVLAGLHEDANSKKKVRRLKKTEVGDALCLGCHERGALVEATAECELLTDEKGTTVNPHDVPDNEGHAELSCISCHEAHESAPVEECAPEVCTDCHHAKVYACGTCHA